MPLSGIQWVSKFPTSRSLDDLSEPFRGNASRFVAALRAANASVSIADTRRPTERAYLMHFSFAIAREGQDPAGVPAKQGVDIQWAHTDSLGNPDLAASQAAAEQMVQGYGIQFKPVLDSRHIQGLAIDMTITWQSALTITDGSGAQRIISSLPRNGAQNADLHQLGVAFGVKKLVTDPPHWSSDGR